MNYKNNQNVNNLMGDASKSLGVPINELKSKIENGKLDEVTKKLTPKQQKDFESILNDPEKAKALMQTPQAKMLMKMLFK